MFPDPIPGAHPSRDRLDGEPHTIENRIQEDVDRIIARWREQHPERDR
ncbi:hypothetical protein NDR87_15405 [Nocardia sp. CDC159]|uniref:Uncharacterized protein n=1 Tax=Nocardia pulmonis TaxID=2951408 RepID=A0A9X2E8E2_9NOCA|nr:MULTISPECIES: hypothetical protein [Nocardia]MCM6775521.1 hypothetical protein [Nocardia pulmonis]MCM6787745.1 hypothetical protein [Nocardia sp. CDC159]